MPSTATVENKPITPSAKRFLNEAEVESSYGISQKTLRAWRVHGRGPKFRKIGSSVRYLTSDLEDWVSSLPTGGQGVPTSALKIRK